jgi:ribonuclease HI
LGQVFLKACLKLEGWSRKAGFHAIFHWIPAHDGIDDNKKANELVKVAVIKGSISKEAK